MNRIKLSTWCAIIAFLGMNTGFHHVSWWMTLGAVIIGLAEVR